MTSLREGLLQGIKTAYCSNLRSQPQWWGNLRKVLAPSDLRQRGDALNDWVCGDGESSYPPPPFEGGQCAVGYLINLANSGTGPSSQQAFATGPISGVRRDGPNQFGGYFWSIFGPRGDLATFRSTPDPGEQWRIASVSRLDGQSDNCGDVPQTFPPPAPITTNINITYGPTNNINLVVPVIFAPVYVSVDARVNVPVTIDLFPNMRIEGTLEIFPDFDLKLEFPSSDGEPGRPDSDPPPAPPPGPGSEEPADDDDENEAESRVFAVLVSGRIESEARPSVIDQESGPDIYAPRLGSVRFGCRLGGRVYWAEDLDIKGLDSVVQCPIPWGATHVAVNAAQGVALNWKPVSTRPFEWPEFLELGPNRLSDNRG